MAGEIQTETTTGKTLYFLVRNTTGSVWNGSAFEAYNNAHWSTYAQTMTEQTGSGYYTGAMVSATAGLYNIDIRQRLGGSPAYTDSGIGTGTINWSGTVEVIPGSGGGGGGSVASQNISLTIASGTITSGPVTGVIPANYPLNFLRGVDYTITTTLTSASGSAIPLSGAVLQFMLKTNANDADTAALFVRNNVSAGGLVVTDAVGGVAVITILNTDLLSTTTFPEGTYLNWGYKLYSAGGIETFLASGLWRVTTSQIQNTAVPT